MEGMADGTSTTSAPYLPSYFNQQQLIMRPSFYSSLCMHQSNANGLYTHSFFNNAYRFENNLRRVVPSNTASSSYSREAQPQEFDYFVVIDFEATCDKGKNMDPQEIIEFPSVIVNSSSGEIEACFQIYIKPSHHPVLTDFCKKLTGIQQFQVNRGVSLAEGLLMHDIWLDRKGIKSKNFTIVTWSNCDCRDMLETECKFKGILKPSYFNRWINLKVPFHETFGSFRCNLKEAVNAAGLTWEGRAHCGLDDARNTARLLVLLLNRGVRFANTDSMESSQTASSDTVEGRPSEMLTRETTAYCFCGVKSAKCMVRKPGPVKGKSFFGCGNWTAARKGACDYFVWAC